MTRPKTWPKNWTETAAMIVATIAVFAALALGREIFLPIALALVVGVVLAPLADAGERVGIPRQAAAILTLVCGLGLLVLGGLLLDPIVRRVIDSGPRIWFEMREFVQGLKAMLRGLSDMQAEVSEALSAEGGGDGGGGSGAALPQAADALWLAPSIAGQALVFAGSLFFFLLTRSEIYTWASRLLGGVSERPAIHRRLMAAERLVSRYFVTITLINAALGLFVAAAMMALGMPSPLVWGVAAMLLNYVVYVGPMALTVALAIGGVVAFDGAAAILPAAIFVAANFTEGQFVTPALVGRRMEVNPLLVFLSLVLWMWLWGPLGGFVAIPLLIWVLALAGQVTDDGTAAPAQQAAT